MGLLVKKIGPMVCVQDLGRSGFIAQGLSGGGSVDQVAILEGAALLGQDPNLAALEMAGFGGEFLATAPHRIALTGAPMTAKIDGAPIAWNTSHALNAGQILSIGTTNQGTYGYLHLGGGVEAPKILESRAAHLTAGIGRLIREGDEIPTGIDTRLGETGNTINTDNRFNGGSVRILPSVHTTHYSKEVRQRFENTEFTRTLRGNRQGVELGFEGAPFPSEHALSILSEPMLAGDIQMTGEGYPFVLLQECQTTGGYPRIGIVLPDDLATVAQAQAGATLRFRFITQEEALAAHKPLAKRFSSLKTKVRPLVRDPHDIHDLLGYQLISGAITGWDENEGTQE